MLTVPGEQKVTFVEGGNGKVQSIPSRICWHDIVGNIDGNCVRKGFIHSQQRQGLNQGKRVVFPWECPDFEFFNHCLAGEHFVTSTMIVPPFACPDTPSNHLGFRSYFMVEARNRCLNVHTGFHVMPLLSCVNSTAERCASGAAGSRSDGGA